MKISLLKHNTFIKRGTLLFTENETFNSDGNLLTKLPETILSAKNVARAYYSGNFNAISIRAPFWRHGNLV